MDPKSSNCLFGTDDGFYICKENYKSQSSVYENSNCYDYHGITKAFHPDSRTDDSYVKFTPKRILVIEMK
jgi:hypothetical protein